MESIEYIAENYNLSDNKLIRKTSRNNFDCPKISEIFSKRKFESNTSHSRSDSIKLKYLRKT